MKVLLIALKRQDVAFIDTIVFKERKREREKESLRCVCVYVRVCVLCVCVCVCVTLARLSYDFIQSLWRYKEKERGREQYCTASGQRINIQVGEALSMQLFKFEMRTKSIQLLHLAYPI